MADRCCALYRSIYTIQLNQPGKRFIDSRSSICIYLGIAESCFKVEPRVEV